MYKVRDGNIIRGIAPFTIAPEIQKCLDSLNPIKI